jgi:hypothetical protein
MPINHHGGLGYCCTGIGAQSRNIEEGYKRHGVIIGNVRIVSDGGAKCP